MLDMARVRARKKALPFNLTKEWCESRWTGRCEVTGVKFIVGTKIRGPFSPSLDQIKPSAGYTQDNCRFILWAVNNMKGVGSNADMAEIAKAIVEHHESKYAGLVLSLPG